MKHTKKMLVMLTLLGFVYISQAQEVKWGIKAGYSVSNFKGDYDQIDYVSGFHAGGLVKMGLNEKWGLQAELLYAMEGGQYDLAISEPPLSAKIAEKVTLGYLNLPLMAQYKVAGGLTLEAGPQIGFLLSGKTEYNSEVTIGEEIITDSGEIDIKDRLKTLSYGVNLGLGYEFKNNLFLQARYHLGLANISKENTTANEEEEPLGLNPDQLKNQGFQFSLGYRF
ncbi:porin family protein [Flavobacterium sedimenticola]|uniref:Porin family protein n=1 Tax=Flavobacterium sedimenticola TaxID=3043286 RepID=A0ABT6XNV9_9FLAO|nr:porin family protein [Flavobacterium sedimenticola]MDI9256780.1 porin family protein [Flavobacterium sedimenticola]